MGASKGPRHPDLTHPSAGRLNPNPFSKARKALQPAEKNSPAQALAQARFLEIWKSGNLGTLKFGNLGTWKSGNLGSKHIKKIKNLKIQVRAAQNVGKVWISRKQNLLAPFG